MLAKFVFVSLNYKGWVGLSEHALHAQLEGASAPLRRKGADRSIAIGVRNRQTSVTISWEPAESCVNDRVGYA
eukprot:3423915-Prymnesium_polylepis.1